MDARANASLGRRPAERVTTEERRLLLPRTDPAEMVGTRQRSPQLASANVGRADVPGLARAAQDPNFDESRRRSDCRYASYRSTLSFDGIGANPAERDVTRILGDVFSLL